MEEALLGFVERLSKWMQAVSMTALTVIMLLTVSDVVLRLFGHPIIGTYEMVGLGGAIIIGFAIPMTSWMRGHIFVDFFYRNRSKGVQYVLNITTRLICIATYSFIGWNLFKMGIELYTAGEVTLTRHLPFYPVAYGLGACCFIQCLVLVCDMFKIVRGAYE